MHIGIRQVHVVPTAKRWIHKGTQWTHVVTVTFCVIPVYVSELEHGTLYSCEHPKLFHSKKR